ncbi:MAG: TonB-dependent receptor [Dysgonamonadaceae bacterium]|jgi:TonB-linked SusC/RagA family outer membrane protein|nr:TonB-dependent receptor [Dysgonamonadaceae bacterium]
MKHFLFILMTSVIVAHATAQVKISGKVNDEAGEALIGASVIEQGTSNGTVADRNGNFTLTVANSATVKISYTGYEIATVKVSPGTTNYHVVLKEDQKVLDEVVVVGYGTVKKSDLTGSVVSISSERMKESIITNLDQALQGRVAGVQLQANSGAPGAANSIRIRGASSVNNSNEPLYVIDGIPVSGSGAASTANFEWGGGSGGQNAVNPLASIAPSDIVSIDVLKDASATAIYGSAGANGVIIVTTKRGEKGKTAVTYDGYVALQTHAKKLDVMNLRDFAAYQMQLYNEGFLPNVDATYVDPSILGEGTDWQDAVTRNAWMQNHNLSLTGGIDNTNYALSLGYTGQDGVILNSDFERYTGRLNLDHQYNKYFKMGGSLSYSQTSENIINNDGINGIVFQSLMMRPDVPVYDLNGNYANPETTEQGSSIFNPVAMATEVTNNLKRQRVMGNVYGQINMLDNLNYRTEFGFDNQNNTQLGFRPNYDYGQFRNAMIMSREEHNMYWLWKNLVNYDLKIDKHTVNLMVGNETSRSEWDGTQLIKDHLSSNDIKVIGADGAFLSNNAWKGAIAKVSFFGRANYNYANRYLLTATMRADGSSRFGVNNRWGYFPSFAAAWRFSNESFLENVQNWLYNGKLRFGYGQNGNDNIGTYLYGSTMNAFQTWQGTAYRMANNANPDLKWETSVQYNAGLDLGFFGGRIDLTVDVYYKTTKDLLLQPSVSPLLGGSDYKDIQTATMNIGQVDNKGVDLSLNTYNINGKDFKWNTNLVFSFNRNEVVALDNFGTPIYPANIQQMIFLGGYNQASIIKVGQPIGVFYGWVSDGLYTSYEDLQNSPKPDMPYDRNSGLWIGDMKFKDISGPDGTPDGVIDDYDQTIIGDPNPDFTFGFNNTFNYKNFELNVGLLASVGGDIFNVARMKMEKEQITWDPQSPAVLNRAQLGYYDGDNTNGTDPSNSYIVNLNQHPTLPRFSNGDGAGNARMSDRWIEDGSYLRIQNISLAYHLPKTLLSKTGIQGVKVYANVQNVYTFTDYSGYDPEIGSFNQSAGFSNVDLGRYPSPRVFTLGANITF